MVSTKSYKIICECGSLFQVSQIQYNDIESGKSGSLKCPYCESELLPKKKCKVDAKVIETTGKYEDAAWSHAVVYMSIMQIPEPEVLRRNITDLLEGLHRYDLVMKLRDVAPAVLENCIFLPITHLEEILEKL